MVFLVSSLWIVVDLHGLSLPCRHFPDPLTQICYGDTLIASPYSPYVGGLIPIHNLLLVSVAIFQSTFFDAEAFSTLKPLSIAKGKSAKPK